MPDAGLLGLTVESLTKDQLAIKVKIGEVALNKSLQLEIALPRYLVSQDIADAADEAPRKSPPIANVDKYVKGAEGKLTVWAEPEMSDNFVTLMFVNDLNKEAKETAAVVLAAGSELIITIPLDPTTHHISIDLPYGYEYDGKRIDAVLELKVEETDWTPKITFTTNQKSPTAIKPMETVKIEWEIENGVSAVISGPLPGGNTEWSLSDNSTSDVKMSKGFFKVIAVSSMTFMLQAEVKGPPGKPNRRVAKMLWLDIASAAKHGYIRARPTRVLPYGLVELDWAAWGVKAVRISAPGASRDFQLTDKTLNGFAQGSGVVRSTAQKTASETPIQANLSLKIEGQIQWADKTEYMVVPWTPITPKPVFTGRPVGLAVAAPKMALLTADGLWIAEVGEYDEFEDINNLTFTRGNTDRAREWLGIAALGDKFVVFRQTDQNVLQVALYTATGARDVIPPVDLPAALGNGPTFEIAAYRDRVYVVVESSSPTGKIRSAFSVRFDNTTKKAEYRSEFLLENLTGYRLLTFDNGLFALNRDSGQMFRLELKDGKLEPYKAASAVDLQGASMIKQGLLVPAGRVLVVLTPTSVPTLASLSSYGLKNVLPYQNLVSAPQDTSKIRQDLVYNPQNDRWSRCGHGLDVNDGVVAYRGGDSARLWLIDRSGETYTLTGASEDLFLPDYVEDLPSKPLLPVFNATREYMFINNTGMQFVRMNDTCFKAGLKAFSATGNVLLTSPLPTGPTDIKKAEPVNLRYNDAESPTATLRFLAKRGPGVRHEYVLEVTLSGPRLSYASVVYKRLTADTQGGVSVVEMPGKLEYPTALGLIEVFPRLGHGIRLRIRNTTPYTLWPHPLDATDPARHQQYDPQQGIHIRYDTPPFSIYAHGVGEMPVDVDFALPSGLEMSPASEPQTKRIRIRQNGPLVIDTESISVKQTGEYDTYECTLRYYVEKLLVGAYIGDGVPGADGASLYVPLVKPPGVANMRIMKIDANNLQTTAEAPLHGTNIFTCPNSIAVLSNTVIAIFNREIVAIFDHALKPLAGLPLQLLELNLITNLKGYSSNSFFTLGMKEQPTWQFTKSYKIEGWTLTPQLRRDFYRIMDFFDLDRPGRVPEAAPWVAPLTISPMDMRPGGVMAICVEGGINGVDQRDNQFEVKLSGTGREEAILVDPTDHFIFCAHSKPSGPGLMISRINFDKPSEKLTIELPGSVYHIVTDPKPPAGPKLDYYRPRAVSLRATSDALFVSHGRKIYVLDKTTLTRRQDVEFDLPLRLIQVRRGKPPGENHPTYGLPQDGYFIWAIGSRYVGNGQTVNADEYRTAYETRLFKIALVP